MFNVNITELKQHLALFRFIKSNELVVDHNLVQLTGVPNEPLMLSMTNGAIYAFTQVSAKIDKPFEVCTNHRDLVDIIKHLDGVIQCEITDSSVVLQNERLQHKLKISTKVNILPKIRTNDNNPKPINLKPFLGMDYVLLCNDYVVAFDTHRYVLKYAPIATGVEYGLTAVQAKTLHDLGQVSMSLVEDQLHVFDGGNNKIIFGQADDIVGPPIEVFLNLEPVVSFELTAAETKELQSLLHSESIALIVKDGFASFIASGNHESTWRKAGVKGQGFIKLYNLTLRDIVGDATVSILSNDDPILRIDAAGVTTFTSNYHD